MEEVHGVYLNCYIKKHNRPSMTIVYTTGVFDLLHHGHITILREAASLGDQLIVGVQDDDSVEAQKNRRPTMNVQERMRTLEALPFVHKCVPYHNIDQRPMLDQLKPHVMFQTEEWVAQSDRSHIISHLNEHNIRLVLFPIEKDMSSTEIKRRVLRNADFLRNDTEKLQHALRILPIDSLAVYEKHDPNRTPPLLKKIAADDAFFNPIVVAQKDDTMVLIDGANRIEALKELGMKSVLVNVVDYADDQAVELRNNVHFLRLDKKAFMSRLSNASIAFTVASQSEAIVALGAGEAAAIAKVADEWMVFAENGSAVDSVNALVDSYLGSCDVYRLSELAQHEEGFGVKIVFRTFTIDEIIALAKEGRWLNSGITWHKVKNSIVRFAVPLEKLQDADQLEEKNNWLQQQLAAKIANREIRYYPSNVYICNEWE